jgi:hypothetical protein
MRRVVAYAALVMGLAACASDRIDVAPGASSSDGNRAKLIAAVDTLRAAGHTAAAYRTFAATVLELRHGMDETVAEEAELLAVTEALPVVKNAGARGESVEQLALAVWPLALAPPIAAPIPGTPQADKWTSYVPAPGEDDHAYLERICGTLLALECKDIVPEGQLGVVGALAVQRLTDRTRRAVATCLTCSDPSWGKTVGAWEELASTSTAGVSAVRSANSPARWPEAGAAAVAVPPASSQVRHVHVPPDQRVERVRYAIDDARKDGVPAIALIARERPYPYRERAYIIPTSLKKLPVREGEPVQMLTRALDARASTGASAARRP